MAHISSPVLKVDTGMVNGKEDATGFSAKESARVLRKLDWRILPVISLLYFLSFMDRINIGNAKIAGMSVDLHLTGLRYNTAAAIFFIPYFLGQVPSNILMKLFRPSRWLPAIMIVWGLIMTLMCLVRTYHGLLAARFFLGLTEAGLFPGLVYYVSLWYPRSERAKRIAIFTSMAIVGGSISGLLAFAIMKMEGIGGLHGWQWIFCLEGLATIIVAFVGLLFLPNDPATASFLTVAERDYIVELLKKDAEGLATHYDFRFVSQALRDYKIYFHFVILIGVMIPAYGIALFTPTIINDLGFSAANAELLSAPPFLAGLITIILCGIYSDKLNTRGAFVIAGAFVAMVGYTILYTQKNPMVLYFGNMLAVMGVAPCIPAELAWVSSNAGGEVKRAAAIAMVSGFGNLGGICSSFIFFDPPRFHAGLAVILACLSLTILLSSIAIWDLNRLNKQKERACHEYGITDDQQDEFKEVGDDSPLFRYTL